MNSSEFKRVTSGHTSLPPSLVADLLGVSDQRVHALVAAGKLEVEMVVGCRWVTCSSLLALVRLRERSRQALQLKVR